MNINWRHWHAWLSIILSIPLFLVGVTAVLIAHQKTLGLKDLPLNGDWLPGNTVLTMASPDIRATLLTGDGSQYLGTKSGLYVMRNGSATAVEALAGKEIRSLSASGPLLMAAGNKGVWLKKDAVWRPIYRHPVHQATFAGDDVIYLATMDNGLLVSRDSGLSWQPDRHIATALANLPAAAIREDYSFSKLVMDVHTGQAFLGKRWEWLWIDSLGLLLVFLSLSGVYLWRQGQKRQVRIEAHHG